MLGFKDARWRAANPTIQKDFTLITTVSWSVSSLEDWRKNNFSNSKLLFMHLHVTKRNVIKKIKAVSVRLAHTHILWETVWVFADICWTSWKVAFLAATETFLCLCSLQFCSSSYMRWWSIATTTLYLHPECFTGVSRSSDHLTKDLHGGKFTWCIKLPITLLLSWRCRNAAADHSGPVQRREVIFSTVAQT